MRLVVAWMLPQARSITWKLHSPLGCESRNSLVATDSTSWLPRLCGQPLRIRPCMARPPDLKGFARELRRHPLRVPRMKMSFSGRDAWRRSLYQRVLPANRVLEYLVCPVYDLWNCCTFRYGEAKNPGPEQRIVSVNPKGWSRMAPLLSTMKEEVILVQETFLAVGSVAKATYEAKACGYHSFFVPAHKPSRGRPQGGLAVLSRVAVPAVVPHSGEHYSKGRWMHVIVHLEVGGRTLHVFNVYGYDESYPDS
eukprot:1436206-Amphidinium_carterae.2